MNLVIIDGLSYALPLLIIAVGGIYSERSGITNLALEGMLGMGAFTGGLFVAVFGGIFAVGSNAPMALAFLFAAIGGGIYAILHALLCIKLSQPGYKRCGYKHSFGGYHRLFNQPDQHQHFRRII